MSGNGQRELLAALSGEDTRAPRRDRSRCSAADVAPLRRRAQRRHLGLHFVPEERLGRGAVPTLSLAQNTAAHAHRAGGPRGWIRTGGAARSGGAHHPALQREGRRARRGGAESLSGGNLQKFIVGREIDAQPKLLIVSQPTWGVDVGAAAQIRGELLALRDAGCAVLVVSEELDELFEICDRLEVIAQGRALAERADRRRRRSSRSASG